MQAQESSQQTTKSSDIYFLKNEENGQILSIWIKKENCVECKSFDGSSGKVYSFDDRTIPEQVSEYFGITFENNVKQVIEEGNNLKIMLSSGKSVESVELQNNLKRKLEELKEKRKKSVTQESSKSNEEIQNIKKIVNTSEQDLEPGQELEPELEQKKRRIGSMSVETDPEKLKEGVENKMSGSLSCKRENFPTPKRNTPRDSYKTYKIEDSGRKFYKKHSSYGEYIRSMSLGIVRIANFYGHHNVNDLVRSCSFCDNYLYESTQKKKDNNHMLCRCEFMCTKRDCLDDDVHSVGECLKRERHYLDYEKLDIPSFLQRNKTINFERN